MFQSRRQWKSFGEHGNHSNCFPAGFEGGLREGIVVYHGRSGCLLLSLVAGSTLLAADSAEAPTTSFKAKACSPLHLKANTGSPFVAFKR